MYRVTYCDVQTSVIHTVITVSIICSCSRLFEMHVINCCHR